jgi:uncharacterized protein (UPF0305 family)
VITGVVDFLFSKALFPVIISQRSYESKVERDGGAFYAPISNKPLESPTERINI